MRPGILTVLAVAAMGCSGDAGPTDVGETGYLTAEAELTLEFGETRGVDGTVLQVSFTDVLGDSRCPVNAACIWQGSARIQIGISAGMGPTFPLVLESGIRPNYADWNGVRVTLLEVMPEARWNVFLEPEDYSIRLRLEEAGA